MDSFYNRAPEGDVEYEEFYNAASEGNIQRLEAALLPSMSLDALEANPLQGRAALHFAAEAGSVPAIQWLLAHGATVDLRNSEGETPLHEAAFWARLEAIQALLAAGADINLPTGDYNYTALLNVLKYKHTVTPLQIETINFLLDLGLDVDLGFDDDWGSSLVGQAVLLNSIELVEILIDRGARIDNALRYASHDYAMVKFLLSRGAPIICEPSKDSAITNAAGGDNLEVIRLLCSHANEAELHASREALDWAASEGRIDTVRLLIEYGFDVNATTEGCIIGETPLIAVCQSMYPNPGRIAVAKLLLENGADVKARDKNGTTAAEMLLKDDGLKEDADSHKLLTVIATR